jgi:integrase
MEQVHSSIYIPLLSQAVEETYSAKWKHGKDSQRSYRRACNMVQLIGDIQIGKIDEQTVSELIRKLESRESTTATINRYLASLKTILKHMKQATDFITLRKERKGRIRVLSKEEELRVIDLLRNTDHGPRRGYFPEVADLVEVLIYTGMRLSEALDMRYEDVDFTTGLISIWINKGDRPRSVPMTSRARRVLETRKEGNPVKPFSIKNHQVETAWKWIRKEMGLQRDKEFVPHALRHTCASRMVNKGIDLYVVKDILGHASILTTQIYAHLDPNKLSHAVSVLED